MGQDGQTAAEGRLDRLRHLGSTSISARSYRPGRNRPPGRRNASTWLGQQPGRRHLTLVPELGELKTTRREDIIVIVGGVVPPQDYDAFTPPAPPRFTAPARHHPAAPTDREVNRTEFAKDKGTYGTSKYLLSVLLSFRPFSHDDKKPDLNRASRLEACDRAVRAGPSRSWSRARRPTRPRPTNSSAASCRAPARRSASASAACPGPAKARSSSGSASNSSAPAIASPSWPSIPRPRFRAARSWATRRAWRA